MAMSRVSLPIMGWWLLQVLSQGKLHLQVPHMGLLGHFDVPLLLAYHSTHLNSLQKLQPYNISFVIEYIIEPAQLAACG